KGNAPPGKDDVFREVAQRRDNSLTQFATLALWAARKHGVDTKDALARIENHFRVSQREDGTWEYTTGPPSIRHDSMTCAGRLGLAAGRGLKPAKSGLNDQAINRGLTHLGQVMAADAGPTEDDLARRKKYPTEIRALMREQAALQKKYAPKVEA